MESLGENGILGQGFGKLGNFMIVINQQIICKGGGGGIQKGVGGGGKGGKKTSGREAKTMDGKGRI